MPKFTPKSLSLSLDGKTVDLHLESAKSFELNKALGNPQNFQEFARDPKAFASRYGLGIDQHVSDQLKGRLTGVSALHELKSMMRDDGSMGATVWAVASGAYSVSSSKIAAAF